MARKAATSEYITKLKVTLTGLSPPIWRRLLVPAGMTLAQMALRFILSNPDVSTVIPGMRKAHNVEENTAASDAGPLSPELRARLRVHRWDRKPTEWSQ